MISTFSTITFENKRIVVLIDTNNIIWFNAKQICSALKYKRPKIAIRNNVDKIDKIQLKNMTLNFKVYQQPNSMYINESGLNSLLILSRTKKSKKSEKNIETT